MIMYDHPTDLGANCHLCPFNNRRFVMSKGAHETAKYRARLVILTDYPTQTESIEHEYLTGSAGDLLKRTFANYGESMEGIFVTAAILCPSRREDTDKDRKQALICCRPRLRNELETIVEVRKRPMKILALGKYALATLTGKDKIFSWLGPTTNEGVTIQYPETDEYVGKIPKKLKLVEKRSWFSYLATFHPKYILLNRKYGPVFAIHVERFIGWYKGTAKPWEWGEELWEPDKIMLEGLEEIYHHPEVYIASDTETDGLHDPITQWSKKTKHVLNLLNVGFHNGEIGISVPWLIIKKSKDSLHKRIKELTQGIIREHPNRIYQNFNYDFPVEKELILDGVMPAFPSDDTLIMHRIIAPEWSHKLGFQACIDTNAPRWKESFKMGDDMGGKRYAKASVKDRGIYNIRDCDLTRRLFFNHEYRLKNQINKGWDLYQQMLRLHKIAMGMRLHGFFINRLQRLAILSKLESESSAVLSIIFETIRKLKIDPNTLKLNHASGLSKVFINALHYEPHSFTPTGKPKFDINTLLTIALHDPNKIAAHLARHIIVWRKLEKVISTYKYYPAHLDFIKRDDGVLPIEVIHPNWIPSAAKTGRWGAHQPAVMTVSEGKKLAIGSTKIELPNMREMFEGHWRKTPFIIAP